jgi:anti-sigma-K factor RskA
MKRLSAELRDGLAFEAAFGQLQAATARRYERRLLMDERLAQAHRAWRRRTERLMGAVTPTPPRASFLARIQNRLKESGGNTG